MGPGLISLNRLTSFSRTIEDQEEKEKLLVKFFCKNVHNKYNIYFYGFIGCEVLNVVLVLAQFGLTNVFLHRRFLWYGPKVGLSSVLFFRTIKFFLKLFHVK